jgi:hypothetical protein
MTFDTKDQLGFYNRLHVVSVAFFVHVAGVKLAEYADFWAVPLEEDRLNMNRCSRVLKQVVRLEGTQDLTSIHGVDVCCCSSATCD